MVFHFQGLEFMQVKSKSGRTFDIPTDDETINIQKGIAADPDNYEIPTETMKALRPIGRPKAAITKQAISIRLSPEVINYFKATGKGWQTRMDEVLKKYVNSH